MSFCCCRVGMYGESRLVEEWFGLILYVFLCILYVCAELSTDKIV